MGYQAHRGDPLWDYLRRGKRDVHGWLQRVDAEIFGTLLTYQAGNAIPGACVEIGVHHGKSFVPLCLSLSPDERALCIDVFGDQQKNRDGSGRGDLEIFQHTLSRFGVARTQVVIRQGSSEDRSAVDILDAVGPVRFFSIDGGHWKSIVMHDLQLAEETLSAAGIIALDDFFRAEWPEVSAAYYAWQAQTHSDIVPFAVGSNKLYLCRKPQVEAYRTALHSTFLRQFLSKTYDYAEGPVDCFRIEPVEQDEDRSRPKSRSSRTRTGSVVRSGSP